MNYGVIGLGNLGACLAGSLLRDGFAVTVYDRNPATRAELEAEATALGVKFDLRQFHAVVLENDYVPLWAVTAGVDRWLAGQAADTATTTSALTPIATRPVSQPGSAAAENFVAAGSSSVQ